MKERLRNAVCLVLSTITVLGATSCGGAGKVNLDDLYIPTYEDKGQTVRLSASLPANPTDRAALEQYKAVGFNELPYAEDFVKAEDVLTMGENAPYLKGLKLCEELGLDAYLQPHNVHASETPTSEPNYFERYFSDIDFRDYPAVKGFFVTDEPAYGKLQDLEARYLPWFNENYGGMDYEFTCCFQGCHATTWKTGVGKDKSYEEYVETYLSIVDRVDSSRKVHAIDVYPLHQRDGTPKLNENILLAHADAAERAKAHGFDLHLCVQTFGGPNYFSWRIPTTFEEQDFALNNTLAFGPERLEFFCYRDYTKDKLVGMVTNGKPNERYYWVQQTIQTFTKWDHIYRNYTWEHLFTNVGTGSRTDINPAFEAVRGKVKPITGIEKVRSKYDIVMTEFKDGDNNKAFMLLNYDEPLMQRANKVTLTFSEAQGILYYRNGEPTTALLDDGKFVIELNAGEAIFAIPLYKK